MKIALKVVGSAIAYVLGVIVTGMLTPVLHLPTLDYSKLMPANADPLRMLAILLLSAVMLMLALVPLAEGLRGGWLVRWFAVGFLLYIAIGLNTMMELKIFSTMLRSSAFGASLQLLLPCVLSAAVLALPAGPRNGPSMIGHFTIASWGGRLVGAWLAFPVCYWVFGMCVAPFVLSHYQTGELGLIIPPPLVILRMQLLRSALFLAASLPGILLWRKSRVQFIIGMGLAHAFAVGIFQLAPASFLPTALRVAHSIEITFDSFAYAAILGLLFVVSAKKEESRAPQVPAPHGAVPTHS